MLNIPYEVQQALRKGDMRKNYKMKVNDVDPDTGERTYLYTIDNNSLVSESVKVDERMVTGKQLKFGLCEGSSLEFQYFDHPNINGKDVQVYCSVEYVDGNGDVAWYDIPMGWYSVDQCPMQWETGIYKVTAYNKLKSTYLDKKANNLASEHFLDNSNISFFDIRKSLLLDYEIQQAENGVDIDPYHGGVIPVGYSGVASSVSVYESQNYGIDSPLANINLSDHKVRILYYSFSYGFSTPLNGDNYSFVFLFGSYLSKFEKYIYEYLADILDTAKYKDSNNIILSGDDILSSTKSDFFKIFGITFQYTYGTSSHATKKYSTIQWEYEEENSIPHTMDGRITDLFDRLILKSELPNNTRDMSFTISFPVGINVDGFSDYGSYLPNIELNGDFQYSYYEDIGHTEQITKEYKGLRFPNGYTYTYYLEYQPDNTYSLSDSIALYEDISVNDVELMEVDPLTLPDFTLRDITTALYEIDCQYGKLDRETDLFAGVELNQGGLYPADTLYPDNALYPSGNMEHPFPSTYSKLWTDTVGEQSFRYLIITYKAMENGQEVEKKLQRTVNEHGTTNYNMSDNWLFRNLVWTAADVGDYADAMVLKMKDIRWFPFEMWCAGLPYVETGDAIEITDKQGNTHTSYVLTRTLDGIHNLQDTFINGELDIF